MTSLAARLVTRSASVKDPAATAEKAAYVAASYRKTPVPTARERHLINRFAYGYTPATLTRLRKAGTPLDWFEAQLHPATVTESAKGLEVRTWFPDLDHDPLEIATADNTGVKGGWEYARDLANSSMLRRVYSTRGVLESMVEFWSNHFHIDSTANRAYAHRPAYDGVIRDHALGTFEDLLVATALHPAMLFYLDNWRSVKNAPNENQGRELLELHTVGAASGYTEDMVKDSAKILSGYTVNESMQLGFYDPTRHTTGAVQVLDFSDANAAADGSALTLRYLRYLANHPATARRIVRKLCLRFVSDNPSDALVEDLAQVFLDSGTDVKATLRALVESDEFWASAGKKVRTPIDDLVATCRVLGVSAQAPVSLNSFAHVMNWMHNSILAFEWPRPDGPPEYAEPWCTPSRMLSSFSFHLNLAGRWWPKEQVTYRKPAKWLPKKRIRFDKLVDHLSRTMLGRASTSALLEILCEAMETAPGEKVTKTHPVLTWKLPHLLAALLDSPAHMSR